MTLKPFAAPNCSHGIGVKAAYGPPRLPELMMVAIDRSASSDVTPTFHPAATRDRPVLSRMSAVEATGGFKLARCFSSSVAKAAGVA